jgi:hypothetical protein
VTAGHCPFCGSPLVAQHVSEKRFKPLSLLPFSIPREAAQTSFKTWISSRWFAPRAFYREVRPDKLKGVYCPFWTYDADTSTSYAGERGDYYYETQTYTVQVNGKTETRTKQVRKTRWYPASGSVSNSFDDLLVRASRGLPEKPASRLGPWELKKLRPYQPEFISGFEVESYTVGLEDGFSEAKEQMVPVIEQTIRRDIGGDTQRIHSSNSSYNNISFKHILLPMWISAYRFQEKTYRFLINANTGEVQGERPYSTLKIALFALGMIATALLIFFLANGNLS